MNDCMALKPTLKQKIRALLLPAKCPKKPETNFKAHDSLFIRTQATFSIPDRIKILVTGKVMVITDTETENVVGRCKTTSTCYVDC